MKKMTLDYLIRMRLHILFSFFSSGVAYNPPTICGMNSGLHMYIEAGPPDTAFQVQVEHVFSGDYSRRFKYKVNQITCNSNFEPPRGCDQYFTGISGIIESYNFDGGYHLNDQDYT